MSVVGGSFKKKRGNTRFDCDWSSDVCSSDLNTMLHCLARNGGGAAEVHIECTSSVAPDRRMSGRHCKFFLVRSALFHRRKCFSSCSTPVGMSDQSRVVRIKTWRKRRLSERIQARSSNVLAARVRIPAPLRG